MGGSILFTQSDTFSPSVYGLTANKFINYIIIGGGGAGESVGQYYSSGADTIEKISLNSGGTNGGATSIGSYVTAQGGTTAVTNTTSTIFSQHRTEISNGNDQYVWGGDGANGWIPGKVFNGYQMGGAPYYNASGSANTASFPDEITQYRDGDYRILLFTDSLYSTGVGALTSYPITSTGNTVGGKPNPYNLIQNAPLGVREGNDGIGYGSGGGGFPGKAYSSARTIAGNGGNSGEFKQGSFKLTSTNNIAITVGDGGTPHTSLTAPSGASWGTLTKKNTGNLNYWHAGRIGTPGAVMLFWD